MMEKLDRRPLLRKKSLFYPNMSHLYYFVTIIRIRYGQKWICLSIVSARAMALVLLPAVEPSRKRCLVEHWEQLEVSDSSVLHYPSQNYRFSVLVSVLASSCILLRFPGLVAFEAGKAIIQSATRPFNHGGHDYYWDNHYQPKANEIVCSMPLSQLQQVCRPL